MRSRGVVVNDPTHVGDDLPAYALDALDAPERVRVAAHLVACDACTRLLEEYRIVVRLLPYGLPLVSPPPRAQAVLLARARGRPRAQTRSSAQILNRFVSA